MKYTAIISFLVVCTLAAVSANEDYEAAQISLGGPGRWGGFGYAPSSAQPSKPTEDSRLCTSSAQSSKPTENSWLSSFCSTQTLFDGHCPLDNRGTLALNLKPFKMM